VDLNFYRKIGNMHLYPIMFAAAKGSLEMINLVLMNKTVDIEVKNESGVNAFWIACNYGHGSVMRKLAELEINIFCCNE
jgi:ankyrin repeat protein